MTEWAISQITGADTALRDRLARSGLLPATGGLTARSGLFAGGAVTLTSGMAVSVAALRAFIQGTSTATQGGYFAVADAAKTLTFGDGGASSRTDLIVAQLYENVLDASGFTKFEVIIVPGTGGGGVPATPANAVKLAEKVITAGMSAGTGGLGTAPTDKRPPRLVAAGGAIPVADATDRATLDVYDGLIVYRIDTAVFEARIGGAWLKIHAAATGDDSWLDVPLGAGFTHATDRTRSSRHAGMVTLAISATKATVGAGDTVCTLAAGFRPARALFFTGMVGATALNLKVDSAGVVTCNTAASGGVNGTITFPAA